MLNRTEFALQSEDLLSTLLENIREGVIVVDRRGICRFFNNKAVEILGSFPPDLALPEWPNAFGLSRADETPIFEDALPVSRALCGEHIHNTVIRFRPIGRPEKGFLSASAEPLTGADDMVCGALFIFSDISDQIRTDERLQAGQERLQKQFNSFPIPTYVWQKHKEDYLLVDFNAAAESITKGKIRNYLGAKLSMLHSASPDIQADFASCGNEKRIFQREFTHTLRSTGEPRNLIATYVPLEPDLVMVHVEDVTEQKRAESNWKKLFNAVEQTADIVIITDREGTIEYVNPAFESVSGYQREEVLGRNPRILRSEYHDPSFFTALWDKVTRGEPFVDVLVNKKKNGDWFWCEQTITAVRDPEGTITHFVSVARDITQLRQKREMEAQLSVAHQIQQRLAQVRIDLAGFDIAGHTFSAAQTCGDFFDFIPMPNDCTGLVIGDVCGKGIGAALIMAETRAFLRAFARLESDPAVILNRLNIELCADLEETQFVTLVLVRLDPKDHSILYASAGHGSGFVLDKDGDIKLELESTGVPLGYIKEWNYHNGPPTSLSPGDTLLLVTDGITEAMDEREQEYGENRIIKTVGKKQNLSSSELIHHLRRSVMRYADKNAQLDDMSALICRSLSPTS